VTPKGRAVLSGHEIFKCKVIQVTSTAKRKERKRKAAAQSNALSQRDNDLLLALKAKRMELARSIGKPAYVVFSDATLIDMAQKRPVTRDQMLAVSGVGAVKFEKFGTTFLEIIAVS